MNEVAKIQDMSLQDLTDSANQKMEEADDYANMAVQSAVDAGEYWIKAKEQVPYGEWMEYVKENSVKAERTVRKYMQLAKDYSTLSIEERPRVTVLPLRYALEEISKIKLEKLPPPEVKAKPKKEPLSEDEKRRLYEERLKKFKVEDHTDPNFKPEKDEYTGFQNGAEAVDEKSTSEKLSDAMDSLLHSMMNHGRSKYSEGVTRVCNALMEADDDELIKKVMKVMKQHLHPDKHHNDAKKEKAFSILTGDYKDEQ